MSARLTNRRTLIIAIPIALALTLAVSFAVSRQGGDQMNPGMSGMSGMDRGGAQSKSLDQMTGDAFDRAFLENMLMHHALAVTMTRPVAARTERAVLRAMSESIITIHQNEIAQIRAWLKDWYGVDAPDPLADAQAFYAQPGGAGQLDSGGASMPGSAADSGPDGAPLPMGGMSMLADLWRLPSGRLEAVYMSMMIPHHQSAVEMTRLAPERARRQEVKDLAVAINRLQTREILQMQQWLGEWFGL